MDKVIELAKELREEIDNLPNVGIIEEGSGGLIKGKDKYVCRHGHRNSADSEYCLTCGENIKGQKEEDVQAIEAFRTLCETLETLLKSE